jgi:hypothetical protein
MTFSPLVPVMSHPLVVPTSLIDQPARCRRSWQASMSSAWRIAAMINHGILRRQSVVLSHRKSDY